MSFQPVHFLVLPVFPPDGARFRFSYHCRVPGFSKDISLLPQTLVPVLHGFLFPGLLFSLGCPNLFFWSCVMLFIILKSHYLIPFFSLSFNKLQFLFVFFFLPFSEVLFQVSGNLAQQLYEDMVFLPLLLSPSDIVACGNQEQVARTVLQLQGKLWPSQTIFGGNFADKV